VGFHEEVLFALTPSGKVVAGYEKLGATVGLDGETQFFGEGGQGLGGVVLVGIEEMDLSDFVFLDPTLEDLRVAILASAVGEATVKDAVASLFQGGGVVTHGGIEKGELLLVVAKVSGPGGGFDHAHHGVLGGRGEQGMAGEKLIAENPDQAHNVILRRGSGGERKNGLFRREAGKEWFHADLCGGDRAIGLG
jgi:hypothetical protein